MKKGILVPIDFSDMTQPVLREARRIAKAFDSKIWLLHVDSAVAMPNFVGYEVGPDYIRTTVAEELRELNRELERHEAQLRGEGYEVTALLVQGMVGNKVLEEAARLKVNRIVLGSHGHGKLYHLLMGSVCEMVIRKAPCPVVIVPSSMLEEGDVTADSDTTAQDVPDNPKAKAGAEVKDAADASSARGGDSQ